MDYLGAAGSSVLAQAWPSIISVLDLIWILFSLVRTRVAYGKKRAFVAQLQRSAEYSGVSWKSVCVAGNALAFMAHNVMFRSWCVFGALCGLTPVHHGCWH